MRTGVCSGEFHVNESFLTCPAVTSIHFKIISPFLQKYPRVTSSKVQVNTLVFGLVVKIVFYRHIVHLLRIKYQIFVVK